MVIILISLSIAPPGINVLEHESIALDVPSSYSTFHPPHINYSKTVSTSVNTPSFPPSPTLEAFKPVFTPIVQPRELPRQRLPESFNLVSPLPVAFSLRSDSTVSVYRARMENRNVVLRVLNGENVIKVCFGLLQFFLFHSSLRLSHHLRLSWRHRKTQLLGFCIFPGTAWTTSIPAWASGRGVTSSSSGHSGGGAGKQRPAQLLVAMQTGRRLTEL